MKNPGSHYRWNAEFMIAHSLSVFAGLPHLLGIYRFVWRTIENLNEPTIGRFGHNIWHESGSLKEAILFRRARARRGRNDELRTINSQTDERSV